MNQDTAGAFAFVLALICFGIYLLIRYIIKSVEKFGGHPAPPPRHG